VLDEEVRQEARARLTIGPRVPDDIELDARYLGYAATNDALAKLLFEVNNPFIDTRMWPYTHIDWTLASAELLDEKGRQSLLQIRGHWFDALAATPVVAV
jgi:hypothetical protein